MAELPVEFTQRIQLMYPDHAMDLIRSFSLPKQKAIRVNTLVAHDSEILEEFGRLEVGARKIPAIPHAYLLTLPEGVSLSSLSSFREGHFYIQSPSSMLASIVVDPQKNELILDACASPGSKTSHLAMLMENGGNIVANDASWERRKKLTAVLSQMHVTNAVLTTMPAEILWRDYENTFDRALADVPCTMEGRIDASDPKSFGDWSVKKIKRLSTEQKGILRSVIRCVKPGGTIIYSTCTLAPEENEEVIDWILTKEQGIELEPISIPDVATLPIISNWNGKTYGNDVAGCLRIRPSQEWEGFFVAKLRKKLSSLPTGRQAEQSGVITRRSNG